MATTELVYVDNSLAEDAPQTHVLIIGVGHYPYGQRGSRPTTPDGEYIRQLSSPPASARRLADWFIRDFSNVDRRLGSVAMLLSEQEAPSPYASPANPAAVTELPLATHVNVAAAAKNWINRLKQNKNNMAIFYFCGHGMAWNNNTTMLFRDFGQDENNPIAEAADVRQLTDTMKNCPAIYQAFFIDCCRTREDDLLQGQDVIGTPLVFLPIRAREHADTRLQAIFHATSEDRPASGRRNNPSLFAEALMEGMSLVAADNTTGDWVVKTGSLADTIAWLIALRPKTAGGTIQIPAPTAMHSFQLNTVQIPPDVRVYVTLSDAKQWGGQNLRAIRTADSFILHQEQTLAEQDPFVKWQLPPEQKLTLEAMFTSNGVVTSKIVETSRPVMRVELPV